MTEFNEYTYVISLAVSLVILTVSLALLRKQYSSEIYIIWYSFSLFFTLVMTILFFQDSLYDFISAENVKIVFGFIGSLASVYGEATLISAFLVVTVIPQVLAYCLSGVSGSASAPLFVYKFTEISIWSVIKFLAIYSAIYLADFFHRIYLTKRTEFIVSYSKLELVKYLSLSVGSIALSFLLLLIYYRARILLDNIQKRNTFKIFGLIHTFFTRNREIKPNTDDE